jgi:uracil-DNA glycosylase family 4
VKDYLDPLKCSYCSQHLTDFVPPEVPENPQLIVVGEAPGKDEREKGRPFAGKAGQLLRPLIPVPAIYINSVNVFDTAKPTTAAINLEREAHLLPLLRDYPGLPVISLGGYAAQALSAKHRMGTKKAADPKKKEKPESSMAGQVMWLFDHPVWFTYHPAYYFYAQQNPAIIKYIGGYIKAALTPVSVVTKHLNELPPEWFGGKFVLDVEADDGDLPFYGAKMTLLGVMPVDLDEAYQFTPDWLAIPENSAALQAWITKQRMVIGHGLMFDILHGEAAGLYFDKLDWFDTIIAEKDRGHDPLWGYGLKATAHMKYGAGAWEAKFHTMLDEMKQKKWNPWVPVDFLNYNANDLLWTTRIFRDALPVQRFVRLDNDYLKYVKRMVVNGLHIDRHALAELLCKYKKALYAARKKGLEQAGLGPDFNFNSPKQLLPVVKRLAGDVENTREQTLMTVFDKHPFIATILDVRGAEKQTEMLREIKHRIAADGLVHAKMTEHGAESSRTTSKEPNIQNWKKDIRRILTSRYK